MLIRENKSELLYHNLDRIINSGKLEHKRIVLFGLNTSSYVTKKYLEKNGYSIYAYIDNNDKKVLETQEFLTDILPRHVSLATYEQLSLAIAKAYKPEELLADYDEKIVVLIASKYYPSMCQQLEKMGYKERVQVFKTLDFYGVDSILEGDKTLTEMKQLDSEEVCRVQLEITNYLQEICYKHGLKCFMGGGTLLGAVRHKGYIPWDDDIDMNIPLPDYKKLIDILIEDDKYDVFTVYNAPEECSQFYMRIIDRNTVVKMWEYPFLTTSGVNIDVFPLIGLPSQLDETQIFFNRIRHLNTIYANSFIDCIYEGEELLQYRKKIRDEVIRMMEQYDFYQSENVGYILSKYWEKDIMPRNIYDEKIDLPFEDTFFTAPKGYSQYLERLFGDYMKLPPEKERYVTHNYRVYKK